jgi:pimeloyl-ACP methyl ester carboxylesterase/DNA-binding winged helix-turn-helix (wHTH) protein
MLPGQSGFSSRQASLIYVFENYELDTSRIELRSGSGLVPVEPQVFDLLVLLIANRGRVVTQDEIIASIWNGRIVSQSSLTSRINAARSAIGDDGRRQAKIKTVVRKGYRFVADVTERSGAADRAAAPAAERAASSREAAPRQAVHFCKTQDGVTLAYARVGSGLTVVKTGNWLNHLEYDWESPVWSHLLHWMAGQWELVRYDARGNGLSDWEVDDLSFDAFVSDLETVMDAAGVERCVLFGASQGCAISIAYAVRYPERVSKLVLYGGFARGRRVRGGADDASLTDAMLTLLRSGWGKENPAFRQMFTSLFVPGGTPEQMAWFNELQRITTSPDNAARIRIVSDTLDVQALLPRVSVPTLVLHCRDDAVQPIEESRLIAAAIPGARFVSLEGPNHLILKTDPGWSRFCDEVEAFISGT